LLSQALEPNRIQRGLLIMRPKVLDLITVERRKDRENFCEVSRDAMF
jgi:hypothetical protein